MPQGSRQSLTRRPPSSSVLQIMKKISDIDSSSVRGAARQRARRNTCLRARPCAHAEPRGRTPRPSLCFFLRWATYGLQRYAGLRSHGPHSYIKKYSGGTRLHAHVHARAYAHMSTRMSIHRIANTAAGGRRRHGCACRPRNRWGDDRRSRVVPPAVAGL